jgi:putative membrane protein
VWAVPGLDFEGSVWLYLGVTILVVLANAIVKPLINLFSLPFIVFTFGLFLLVTNALVLQLVVWLSESVFELGLTSDGFFWSTFLGALVISVVSTILQWVLPD